MVEMMDSMCMGEQGWAMGRKGRNAYLRPHIAALPYELLYEPLLHLRPVHCLHVEKGDQQMHLQTDLLHKLFLRGNGHEQREEISQRVGGGVL